MYDGLYVGNGLSAQSLEYLKSQGISHLLNSACPGPDTIMGVSVDEDRLAEAGIQYLGLKLDDNPEQEILSTFHQTADWIQEALSASDNNRVLVNCYAGMSRSATLALAFLVTLKQRNMLTI